MTDENVTTTTEVTPRRKWRFDPDARTVTMIEPSGSQSTYPLGTLPAASVDFLAQLGLILFCGRADAPDEAYDALAAGTLPARRGEAKPKIVSHWKAAIALAVVDFSKKSGAPISADEAAGKVASMPKTDIAKLKSDPAVLKHWRRLSGTEAVTVASLLAA